MRRRFDVESPLLYNARNSNATMKLHFIGGIDTVTGSQHIVEANGARVLRDCGMFQGRRQETRELNRNLKYDPTGIDALVLSHAHIDHCGNIPTLVKNGFRGPIYATPATTKLCDIMLHDAAHIQEQDAAYLNQKTGREDFEPVEPLYTVSNAEDALALFRSVPYDSPFEAAPGITVTFKEAGHILGAALTQFDVRENGTEKKIGYAFDLGRKDQPIIRDPEVIEGLDLLVMESTYGDRYHDPAGAAEEQLRKIVDRTYKRGGKVLIPSFALERTQEIIYHLVTLVEAGKLPGIPVYVDSPMATAVSVVFAKSQDYFDEKTVDLIRKVGSALKLPWIRFVGTVEESKAVTASDEPCIVISASGMCEHGRILHHLKHGVENPKNAIVIVGFQAVHTLGRRIVERQEEVRIFGDTFKLNAEVAVLNAFSAHADKNELLAYARAAAARQIYLVHGEPDQRAALAEALRAEKLGEVHEPAAGEVVDL
ncbi:MAG: MBL fold metallo-hydrolase [Kiritimatiellae bacterium]|nr:MBL fold metallo-hydrolase [Kiritimatiellia bacterium]